MISVNFEDPQTFLAGSVNSYLRPPESGDEWSRLSAIAKRFPQHFIVLEPVPGVKDRFLTIGRTSDYPAQVLAAPRQPDSIVLATLVKEKLSTWAAMDWLADLLSNTLGRRIMPEQIRHSGLKDRWAVTAQSIVIHGVTVEELNRVRFPHTPGKAGFFLKDFHWHDARTRVHASAAQYQKTVYNEVCATLVVRDARHRQSALDMFRTAIETQLSRRLRPDDIRVVRQQRDEIHVRIPHTCVSDLHKMRFSSESGLSLKDVRLHKTNALSKGDHRQNRFQLKVLVKGVGADAVSDYMAPLLARLRRYGYYIPNAINFQRLAARQLGHMHGYTLITGDYNSPDGVHDFGSASEAALYRFLFETSGRENPAAEQMRNDLERHWLYDFDGMQQKLQRTHGQLNMSVEYKIAQRLADTEKYRGDFQEVVRSMHEEVSMWVAAWQSWWWNRVLVRKLPHWTKEMDEVAAAREKLASLECTCSDACKAEEHRLRCECSCDDNRCKTCSKRSRLQTCQKCKLEAKVRSFNPLQKGMPLLMDSPIARKYYERLPYCKDAVSQLNLADEFVTKQFLQPRGNSPWRKAFIKVEGLQHEVSTEEIDGVDETVLNLQFELPSGAYATTLLGLMFELEEPNKGRNAAAKVEEADLSEETE